jgi:transcriptional regulator with XRE-family HTH domain
MNGFRKNLLHKLKNKVFRDEYVGENVRTGLAYQIKAIREQRGWTQAYLARLTGKKQSNIARLEDPDYGKFNLQTLLDLASAFDVWLSIEFVSFGTGLMRTLDRSPGALGAESFTSEFAGASKTSGNVDYVQSVESRPVFLAWKTSNPISAPTIGPNKYSSWEKWSSNQTMAMH